MTHEASDVDPQWLHAIAGDSGLEGAMLDAAVAEALGMVGPWITNEEDMTRAFRPSSEWEDGGPIIERERISVGYFGEGIWTACHGRGPRTRGPTPLIAAMRCHVASKRGEEPDH